MKGVTFLTDETHKKSLVQLDITEISKNPGTIEDLIDVIVAESRKNEKKIPWEEAKKTLRKTKRNR